MLIFSVWQCGSLNDLFLDLPALDAVQRNWRRCETLRGKRIPLRLFPAPTTWSWPNCYWTSESYKFKQSPCRKGAFRLVVLIVFIVINAPLLSVYVVLYLTRWFVCLCSASDNIPKADEIRTLVKDIWDTRIAKLRLSADSFISQLEAHAKVKLITMSQSFHKLLIGHCRAETISPIID